jgi:predicted membrane protein (TIGR00267 family)
LKVIEGFQGAAFGLADGVICILGMIIGSAVATWDLRIIVVAAVTGGIADALGNAIGFYLSELSERGLQIHDVHQGGNSSIHSMGEVIMSGIFSFLATILVLVLLLVPFVFLGIGNALMSASAEGIIILFLLGIYVAKLSRESPLRTAIKYVVLGIIGALFSYLVGDVLKIWLLLS